MLQLWHWAKPRTPLPLISEFQRMFPLWNLRMFMQGFFPARLLQSGCFFMLYWLLDHLQIEGLMWVRIMDGWYQGLFFASRSSLLLHNLICCCFARKIRSNEPIPFKSMSVVYALQCICLFFRLSAHLSACRSNECMSVNLYVSQSVSTYACMHAYEGVWLRICAYVYVCVCMCLYLYVCVCMCLCVYVCVCVCTVVYVCMYVCVCMCVWCRHVWMYVCMYACMNACMYVRTYVCMHVCMHVWMYVCTYVCM